LAGGASITARATGHYLVYFWAVHGHHSHRAKIYQRKTPLYGTGKIFLSQPTLTQDI